MTLTAILRRMQVAAVPHGFRSTFRNWASEKTNHSPHVCEMARAHIVSGLKGDYRRGNLFEERCRLMSDWARYGNVFATNAKVYSIAPRRETASA